jgi:hypothetical protein
MKYSGLSREGLATLPVIPQLRLRRLAALAVLMGVLVAVTPAAARAAGHNGQAARAETQLIPPPPDWYRSCQTNGSGTICHGKKTFTEEGLFDAACPQGFLVLADARFDETAARYYNRDGYLVRRVLHDVYHRDDPVNVSYNSLTGRSLPYWADVTETDEFTVPADFGSIAATVTGNLYTATAPGGGILAHDVGLLAFAPDGSLLADRGPKMLFDGLTEELCAALT